MTARAVQINYAATAGAQNFTVDANWVGGIAPGASDLPIISSVDGIVDYPYIDTSVSVQRFLIAEFTGNSGGLEIRSGGTLTTSLTSAHFVGARGTGHLRILDGATLNINGSLQVGWGDGTGRGNGTVTQSGGTYNGTSSSTTMTIGNSAASGEFPASVGVYNLIGGAMELGAQLVVGNAGIGTFNMNGGSLTTNNFLQVGRTGTGTFNHTAGDVTVIRAAGDALVIGPFAGATGLYEISGGSLSVTSLDGSGGVANGVATDASSAIFKVVGNAPTIAFNNSYLQYPTATLAFDIGAGISPIGVGANATLNGILDVNFTTTPTAGQQFTIMNYGGALAGTFSTFDAQVDSPLGANSVNLSINYGSGAGSSIVLTVDSVGTPLVPGDFDGDGDVDGADFVVWQTNFPTAMNATLADGDADGDGDVDGADFVVWQTNFPTTPGPGVAPVPEPQAFILIMLGGLIGWSQRRRFAR